MKYSVTEIVTRAYGHKVKAADKAEAERLVLAGQAERIPERDTTIERVFEIEEIKEE